MSQIEKIDVVVTPIGYFGMFDIGGIPNYDIFERGKTAVKFEAFTLEDLSYLRTLVKTAPELRVEEFKDYFLSLPILSGSMARFLKPEFIEQIDRRIKERIIELEKRSGGAITCENQTSPEEIQNCLLASMFLQYVRQHGQNFLDFTKERGISNIINPPNNNKTLILASENGAGNSGHGPYKIKVYDIVKAIVRQEDIVTRQDGENKNQIFEVQTWDLERRCTLAGTGVYAFEAAIEKLKTR